MSLPRLPDTRSQSLDFDSRRSSSYFLLSRLGSLAPTVARGLPSPPFLIASLFSLSLSLSWKAPPFRRREERGSIRRQPDDRRGLTFARSYTPPTTMPCRKKSFFPGKRREGKKTGKCEERKTPGYIPPPRKKSYLALPGKLRSFPSLPSQPVASQVDLRAAREKPDVTCVTDFGGKDFPRYCPAHGCPVQFRRSCVHLFLFSRSFPRRNK